MTTTAHDVRIEMADGVRLSARVWLPDDRGGAAVPAVLECNPYRKNDAGIFTQAAHRLVAENGYASVQLDLRGSGESEGVLADEYLPIEQDDIVSVIAWLRTQEWCSGSVGMFGISWGGFNTLQVAARRPPGLDAVIAVCATDDRFADDVHYMGGAVIASDMLSWSTTMLAYNARPPDPRAFGEGWREVWQQRIDADHPWVGNWLAHQHKDEYWRQGSVGEDPGAIRCPLLIVGGWADGYRNAIERMLRDRPEDFTRAIVGPWSHSYPDRAVPGPQIGWVEEMLRWWDHWLKGTDRGVEADPVVRAYLQQAARPGIAELERSGAWLALEAFPTARPVGLTWDEQPTGWHLIRDEQTSRVVAPTFYSVGPDPRWSLDQRDADDAHLAVTTLCLDRPLSILGSPRVRLEVRVDQRAVIVVRLCDVWPDGSSALLSRGVRVLSAPGTHHLEIVMDATSVVLPIGHRLRVCLSPSAWPLIWPIDGSTISVNTESIVLDLPTLEVVVPVSPFGPSQSGPMPKVEFVGTTRQIDWSVRSCEDGSQIIDILRGYPMAFTVSATGLTYDDEGHDSFRIDRTVPGLATASSERTVTLSQGGWKAVIEAQAVMTSDVGAFVVDSSLRVSDNRGLAIERTWVNRIPRRLC